MFSVKVGATRIGLGALLAAVACGEAGDVLPDGGVFVDGGGPDGSNRDAEPVDLGAVDGGTELDGAVGLGAWLPLAPLGAGPRQETAVVALGGEIYVVGGFDAAGTFGPVVEAYDPHLDRWRRVADVPVRLHHANAAAVGGRLYVLGFLGAAFQEDGRGWVYDPAVDRWDPLPPLPPSRARGAAAVAVLDERIYLLGGLRRGLSVADVDVFDPADRSFRPLPPLPSALDHLGAGAIDGRIYAVGGRAGGITGHTADLQIYDPGVGAWTPGSPMPTSRGGFAAAVLGASLYVLGGEGNTAVASGVFAAVERYHAPSDTWTTLAPMDPGRHGTGAAALGDRIYVPGGAAVQAFGAVDRVEAFVP